MSRDVESIRAAFDRLTGAQMDSQVQSFPPGHFVGFYLSINGGQVIVGPGEANCAGYSVILKKATPVEENAWAIPRERQFMYYIYIKRDGTFWVDRTDPTWVPLYNGSYHPVLMYRYLGKMFNDSTGKIIYKLSAHYDQQSSIVVGAKGFTGYMDYECDGVADQEEINLALRFASESGEELGGKVHLTRGYFLTTAAVEGLSNCVLEGEGAGATIIKKNCDDRAIACIGTSVIHKESFQVRDLTVTRDAADASTKALVYWEYVDNLTITRCTIEQYYGTGLYLKYTNGTINNNVCTSVLSGGTETPSIMVLYSDDLVIANNTLGPNHAEQASYGIFVFDSDGAIVTGNVIKEITSCFSDDDINAYGILSANGRANLLAENIIHDCHCLGFAATQYAGIGISGGTDTIVANNRVRDCGNLIWRGNCEGTLPPYLANQSDDTQVNCTFARTASATYTGSYSYLFTKTAATGTQARSYFHLGAATAGNMCGLVAGTEHKLSMYFKVPTGIGTASAFYIGIADNSGGGWASTTQALAETYDEWQGVSCTRTLTATATSIAMFIGATASATLNCFMYTDHIRCAPMGVHNEYSQNFSDAGTGTRESGNSWQSPFEE